MKKSLIFLTVFSCLVLACSKESLFNESQANQQNTNAAYRSDSNARVVDALNTIEQDLNAEYSQANTSFGYTESSEIELNVPLSNGAISSEQLIAIKNSALNLWATTYNNFNETDKKAVIIDLELRDASSENAIVKINATVAPDQELGNPPPCDQVTFPTGNYQVVQFAGASSGTKFAGVEIAKKFNQKIANNHCIYYTNVKTVTLPIFQVSSSKLNETQMQDAYCFFKDQISKLAIPSGSIISSVEVKGDMLVCGGCGGKLTMKVTYGVRNVKPNCDPRYPPMIPEEL